MKEILSNFIYPFCVGLIMYFLSKYLDKKLPKTKSDFFTKIKSIKYNIVYIYLILSILTLPFPQFSIAISFVSIWRITSISFSSKWTRVGVILNILVLIIAVIFVSISSFYFLYDYFNFNKIYFNTSYNDKALLRISNRTRDGYSDKAWSYIKDAYIGDTLVFLFYYHNSGKYTARNVRLKLKYTIDEDKLFVSGALFSSNSLNVITGSCFTWAHAVIHGLGYIDYSWYPFYQTNKSYALLDNQTCQEITNSNGILIGNLDPGWKDQGYLIVRYYLY